MSANRSFIRKPHESDPTLILSECARCNAPIGAASTHAALGLMENTHACPLLEDAAAFTAKQGT